LSWQKNAQVLDIKEKRCCDSFMRISRSSLHFKRVSLFLALIGTASLIGYVGWSKITPQPVTVVQQGHVKPQVLIRVAFSSVVGFGDLPVLLAHELLSQRGYDVQSTFYAQVEYAVEALSRGDADIDKGAMRPHWAAVGKGAKVATIAEQQGDPWVLYATSEIRRCSDLDGKRFAISGEGAISSCMSCAYVSKNCPGIQRQILLIQGSQNRAAALLTGEVDATPLELADFVRLQRLAPGRFHALTVFSSEFPRLKSTGIQVNTEFASKYPEVVRDYLRSLITVHRQIYLDHEMLKEAAKKYLSVEQDLIPEITEAYIAQNIWDRNGGLLVDDLEYSIRFLTEMGQLKPGLTVEDVANLSYLDSILNELGRQH
jgi:NitT/TauT family transport system substrate-binding protein